MMTFSRSSWGGGGPTCTPTPGVSTVTWAWAPIGANAVTAAAAANQISCCRIEPSPLFTCMTTKQSGGPFQFRGIWKATRFHSTLTLMSNPNELHVTAAGAYEHVIHAL